MFKIQAPVSIFIFILVIIATLSSFANADPIDKLTNKRWFSGSENCQSDRHKPIEVYQYNLNSYILRQNKCLHYEAPFMYLLFGEQRALLIDTGATTDQKLFPLANTIEEIIAERENIISNKKFKTSLIVAHSHSHSDHVAADAQFNNLNNVEMVKVNDTQALIQFFSFKNWPLEKNNFRPWSAYNHTYTYPWSSSASNNFL